MQHVECFFVGRAILVYTNDDLLTRINARLGAGRGFFDSHLRYAGLDRFRHAAQCFHFADMGPSPLS